MSIDPKQLSKFTDTFDLNWLSVCKSNACLLHNGLQVCILVDHFGHDLLHLTEHLASSVPYELKFVFLFGLLS